MPSQSGSSSVLAKLGNKLNQAVGKHKADETVYPTGGRLPPGIEQGVAQLISITFGEFKSGPNQGKPFAMAQGVVKLPTEHRGIPIEGLRTNWGPEPLCDTTDRNNKTTTFEEHVGNVLNMFRMLGLNTAEYDDGDLGGMAEALVAAEPHFRYRTWEMKAKPPEFPNPRQGETWGGSCEHSGELSDPVQDNTAQATKPSANGAGKAPFEPGAEEEDLQALGALADTKPPTEDGVAAAKKLAGQAKLFNLDPEAYATWSELATAIEAESANDTQGSGESAPADPVKGETCFFKPPRARKAVECEVTAVFPTSKKVNLKNLTTGDSYKSIEWSALQETA